MFALLFGVGLDCFVWVGFLDLGVLILVCCLFGFGVLSLLFVVGLLWVSIIIVLWLLQCCWLFVVCWCFTVCCGLAFEFDCCLFIYGLDLFWIGCLLCCLVLLVGLGV